MSLLYECPANDQPLIGTISYYSYRHLKQEASTVLYALDQLRWQWIQASELYYEPSVGAQKLLWWQQQIDAMGTANCQAPQLKRLIPYISLPLLKTKLGEDIAYSIQHLNGESYSDLLTHCQHNHLGIAVLQGLFLSPNTDASKIKNLNTSNELLRHIHLMGKHYSRQIIFDDNIQPQMSDDIFKKIAFSWLQSAQNESNVARVTADKLCKPLYRYNKIHHDAVKKLIQSIQSPFTESIEISPTAMLWYSLCPLKKLK